MNVYYTYTPTTCAEQVGHMHQRMARAYGDLSADVPDPVKDWEQADGATRLAWDMAKRAISARQEQGAHSPKLTVSCSRSLSQSNRVPYVWSQAGRRG